MLDADLSCLDIDSGLPSYNRAVNDVSERAALELRQQQRSSRSKVIAFIIQTPTSGARGCRASGAQRSRERASGARERGLGAPWWLWLSN